MFLLKACNPERFRERIEQTNLLDIDPDRFTPEMLNKIAEHLIKQELGERPPEVMAEVKRRLVAGEPMTVDVVTEDVTEKEPGA